MAKDLNPVRAALRAVIAHALMRTIHLLGATYESRGRIVVGQELVAVLFCRLTNIGGAIDHAIRVTGETLWSSLLRVSI